MNPVWGSPVSNPWPVAVASCGCGSETQGAAAVPRSEGNEVAREGRQEVGVLYSTEEAGEPTRPTASVKSPIVAPDSCEASYYAAPAGLGEIASLHAMQKTAGAAGCALRRAEREGG